VKVASLRHVVLTRAFAALTRFQGVSTKPTKLATGTTSKIIAARQRPQHAGLETEFYTGRNLKNLSFSGF